MAQATIEEYLERLRQVVEGNVCREDVVKLMKELVPTYRTPEEHNAAATVK